MTTNPDLAQARKWAKDPSYQGDVPSVATARVIASLPDEWIDADELRGVIGRWDALLADDDHEDMHGMLDDLRALLPTPTPRTLADMTPDEREACRWMQADFGDGTAGHPIRVVITKARKTTADIILPDGAVHCVYPDDLIPLPDLPRMVWPEEHRPATDEDVSIIPPKIDTSGGHDDFVDMTPEDVPAGEAWLIEVGGQRVAGIKAGVGFGYRDVVRTWAPDHMVTLVSRLVPEVTA